MSYTIGNHADAGAQWPLLQVSGCYQYDNDGRVHFRSKYHGAPGRTDPCAVRDGWVEDARREHKFQWIVTHNARIPWLNSQPWTENWKRKSTIRGMRTLRLRPYIT